MSEPSGPEWISTTIVDATMLTDAGRRPVRLRVGIIELPNGGGRRVASQVLDEGRPVVLLPPRSIAPIMGALRRGLLTL